MHSGGAAALVPGRRADTDRLTRMARFLVIGVVNTAFGYGIYALLVLLGLHPQPALAIQYIVGIGWNYFTHGRFVFGVSGLGRLPHYALSYVAIYLGNAAALRELIAAGLGPYAAQALALGPTVVLSYILVSLALGVPLGKGGGGR
jgi:putative flippase GtrA